MVVTYLYMYLLYLNTRAVARGSKIFITTPLNLAGLYSENLVLQYMSNKFSSQSKLTVEIQFLKKKIVLKFIEHVQ